MSTWKEKRDIIGGVLIVGFLMLVLGIELAGLSNHLSDFINEGFFIGAAIFILGVILVAAYVSYYD